MRCYPSNFISDLGPTFNSSLDEIIDIYSAFPAKNSLEQWMDTMGVFVENSVDAGYGARVGDMQGAFYGWKFTKGVYRFDPELFLSLTSTDLKGDMPVELLERLPGYVVFVETPGVEVFGNLLDGFWAFLQRYQEQKYLVLVGLRDNGGSVSTFKVPLDKTNISELIHAGWLLSEDLEPPESKEEFNEYEAGLKTCLSLLLYLCSEEPDIDDWNPPTPKPRKTGKKKRFIVQKESAVWDVGVRVGSAIREFNSPDNSENNNNEGSRVRPHIRAAHWHSFWTGKKGEQLKVIKWLPPIPVNVSTADLPTVIRPVKRPKSSEPTAVDYEALSVELDKRKKNVNGPSM